MVTTLLGPHTLRLALDAVGKEQTLGGTVVILEEEMAHMASRWRLNDHTLSCQWLFKLSENDYPSISYPIRNFDQDMQEFPSAEGDQFQVSCT